MAHLRWWAEKIGKAGVLPADNTKLGVPERRYVTNESKAGELGDRLDRITDPHVRMSLRLQAAFVYIQQRHVYDGQCRAAGLSNRHGLRHRYAQIRYRR